MKKWMAVLLAMLMLLCSTLTATAADAADKRLIWDGHEEVGVSAGGDTQDILTSDGTLGKDGTYEWVLVDDGTSDLCWDVAKFTRPLVLQSATMPGYEALSALEFDIYVSDAAFGEISFMFEVSSSGTWDKNEREGLLTFNDLVEGGLKAGRWQTARLDISKLNGGNSGFLPKGFNFFRLWNKTATPVFENGLTVAIRDLYAVPGNQTAEPSVNDKGIRVITMNGDALGNGIVNIPNAKNAANMAHRFLNFNAGDAIERNQHAVSFVLPGSMNILGKEAMCFDLYLEGYEYIKDVWFSVELTSSGECDNQEINAVNVTLEQLTGTALRDGWNAVEIPLAAFAGKVEGTRVPGPFDATAWNYFRTYICGGVGDGVVDGRVVAAIDNVYFSGGGEATSAVAPVTMENGDAKGNGIVNIPTAENADNMASRFLSFKAGDEVKLAGHAVQFVVTSPRDLTGMDTMCFDLYLEGHEYARDLKFEIELTSSGQCDNQEIKMVNVTLDGISNVELKDGWNRVEMPLRYFAGTTEGKAVPGPFNETRWNFMRTYVCGGIGDGIIKGDVVAAIDNVSFKASGAQGGEQPSEPTTPAVPGEDGSILLNSCDTADRWGGNVTVNTSDAQQGRGCIEWRIPAGQGFVLTNTFAPVDATGTEALLLDLYISSVEDFYSSSAIQLEMTSSGTYDVEESAWNLSNIDLVDGWNHLALALKDAGGACDLSRVNFLRFYALDTHSDEEMMLRLDNIRLGKLPENAQSGRDLSDFFIGRKDGPRAEPVEKELTVNTPYDPWTQEKAGEVSGDGDTELTAPSGDAAKMSAVAVVLIICGGVLAILGVILIVLKKGKLVVIVLIAVGLVLIVVGIVIWAAHPENIPAVEPGEQEPVTETVMHPYFTTDQTGHPEVSADEVDVKALLTVDENYNVRQEYTIRYEPWSVIEDFSSHAHVLLHEGGATDNGLSLTVLSGAVPEFIHMKDRDSWMLEHWNDTARLGLSVDDASATALVGKDVALTFVVYLTQKGSLEVEYTDAAGQTRTARVACEQQIKQWAPLTVVLENVAFSKAFDGQDVRVSCKEADIVRLHAVYAKEYVAPAEIQLGLIHSEFEMDSYIIADANVLSFGAKGDGASDDTMAFKEAIEYVKNLGGGTVFVPAGYYCLTDTLTLPASVGLVGELEMGTARGTVLCIYGDKGRTAPADGAIVMHAQSAVINMAFWYPEQTIVNGRAIPYPPTLVQDESEGVTIRNVTLVNSYTGIHFAKNTNNSLQYVRDVYGTCLELGYINNLSLDIGRVEHVTFTPDIWLSSGLPGTPNATLLRTYMLRNSTGMQLQRIDWTYFDDITVEGYRIGMLYNASEAGMTNGHMYNIKLLDCYYCVYAENLSWLIASDCTLRAAGGNGAAAVYILDGCGGQISLTDCTLTSAGANALVNLGSTQLSLAECTLRSVSDSTYVNASGKAEALINTELSGNAGNPEILHIADTPTLRRDIDHARAVVTKPTSDILIDLSDAPYSIKSGDDVTDALQTAIDSLRGKGGTVYIPAGQYYLNDHITVHAGIEVRGAVAWSQKQDRTKLLTNVGENDPDGAALFTLYDGAGLRGFGVVYTNQTTYNMHPYSYTVRGDGKDIYIVSLSLGNAWRMIDFATNRCDDHYVEYLQGVPLETGIAVGGGSENGIIRDCQLTPNTWKGYTPDNKGRDEWSIVYDLIMDISHPYRIGQSKNQILYHNFVYGAHEGLSVTDGAQDVYILGHGVDGALISSAFSGDCSVTMIDSQLVNYFHTGKQKEMHYVITNDDFVGELTLITSSFWGPTTGAFDLKGQGDVKMYNLQMHVSGVPMCRLDGGSLTVYGMLQMTRGKDFVIGESADALVLSGNVFPGGLQIETAENANALMTGTDIEK